VSRPKATRGDVAKALAYRLRAARDESWDDDRCHFEASAFIGEMRARGWEINPDAAWRPPVPPPPATPEVREAALQSAREAIRNATPPPSKKTPEGT
jgi:hypothetical protein